MPTGYTDKIYNGVPQTFEEFALDCARAFGTLVTLREERNAEIPDAFEPSSYHQKQLDQALMDYEYAVYAADYEIEEKLNDQHSETLKRYAEGRVEKAELLARYTAMLDQVKAWNAPTLDHVKYREFMIEQLEGSIKFDCSDYYDNDPELLSVEDFRAEMLDQALWSLNYHWKMHNEEVARTRERNNWIQALRGSLNNE